MPSPDLDSLMWARACEQLNRADSSHRDFFHPASRGGRQWWVPPADVFETPDGLCVVVALPGVRESKVDIVLAAGRLTIRGERDYPDYARNGNVNRLELPYGRFERRIPLGLPMDIVSRRLQDGCLYLLLRGR